MKIESDKQFVATNSAVKAILEHYGYKLVSYKAASSGIENTTLLVTAKPHNVVIRIYRLNKKPLKEMELEASFMDYLYKGGIKVPKIILNNKHNQITHLHWDNKTWQIIALELISGEHALKYTDDLIKNIASWQAKMHIVSSKYTLPADAPRLGKTLTESYFLPLIDTKSITNIDIKLFLERAKKYNLKLDDALPSGLCHLDYDKENLICENNSVKAILDFDDLAVAPYILCLGYTLWHIWRYGSKEMTNLYLSKYEEIRPLDSREKKVLPSIILFRHYMISDLKILNGHVSPSNSNQYTKLEQDILKLM